MNGFASLGHGKSESVGWVMFISYTTSADVPEMLNESKYFAQYGLLSCIFRAREICLAYPFLTNELPPREKGTVTFSDASTMILSVS